MEFSRNFSPFNIYKSYNNTSYLLTQFAAAKIKSKLERTFI